MEQIQEYNKPLRTNSKKYINNIQAFILDSIQDEEREEDMTPTEKIDFFFSRYDAEYNLPYNQRHYPNHQERLSQYLSGLPSTIALPFTYYDIINTCTDLLEVGRLSLKVRDKICSNWFNHVAYHLLKLKDKYNV